MDSTIQASSNEFSTFPPLARHFSASSILPPKPSPSSSPIGVVPPHRSHLSTTTTKPTQSASARAQAFLLRRAVSVEPVVKSNSTTAVRADSRASSHDDVRRRRFATTTQRTTTTTTPSPTTTPTATTTPTTWRGKYRKQRRSSSTADGIFDETLVCERHQLSNDAEIAGITHLRLDRAGLVAMTNLDRFANITHLYLQHNKIARIEGLEYLPSLRFLILAHNQITQIEGLDECWELRLLDLSHNDIAHVDAEMLPPDVAYLLLEGNPCARLPAYRLELVQRLSDLAEIDEEPVTEREREIARTLRPVGSIDENPQPWKAIVYEGELDMEDFPSGEDDKDHDNAKEEYDAALAAIVHRSRMRQAEGVDELYAGHIAKLKHLLLNRRHHEE
ncbi:hypothetical protein HDU87_001846 [Geranomyces variabilis]|uniref:Uncharacterized protein n=1 Tax=Geranomyces variabilis TaxID=109894 RepID=A0AAD5TN12_9FUNG|nr:hypothetical protein HDU87_001846 [Geranomyces variabilis]